MTTTEIDNLNWVNLPNKLKAFFKSILTSLTSLGSRVTDLEDISGEVISQYSTTEVNTKSKWIDNKDIYRIVFDGTTDTSSNIIDVTSLNIENVITLNGGLDDGDVFFPCVFTEEQVNGDIVISSLKYLKSDKLLVLNYYQILSGVKENIAGLSYKIIIEYTKTT